MSGPENHPERRIDVKKIAFGAFFVCSAIIAYLEYKREASILRKIRHQTINEILPPNVVTPKHKQQS